MISRLARVLFNVMPYLYAQYECKTYKALMTAPYKQSVDTTGFDLRVIDLKAADSLPPEYDDIRDYHPRARKALECGAITLAYYQGKRLTCFYFTASTSKAKKAVCPVHFYDNDEVIVGMGQTVPEFRNRGLLQAIIAEAYNYQFSLGHRKFKGIVGVSNSQCLHSIGNFRANQSIAPIIGRGVYTKILWLYRWKELE